MQSKEIFKHEKEKNNMKSKWKYGVVFILVLIFVVFIIKYISSIKQKENHVPVDSYAVSVIETSTQTNRSTITYYDNQLQEQGKQSISYGGLCEGTQPIINDNKAYLFAAGDKMSSKNIVLEIDLISGVQKEYNMPEDASSWSLQVDDENMYVTSNTESLIYSINKETEERRTLKFNQNKAGYVSDLVLNAGVLYVFCDNFDDKSPSYLYEIDVNALSVVEKTDIRKYGQCLVGSCFYNDKLYVSFSQLGDNTELDYICEYSLKTKEVRKIGVGAKNPIQIKEYNGLLYIVHSDKHDEHSASSISIYNPKTEVIENKEFKRHISSIEFMNDKMYLYGDDMLSVYSMEEDKMYPEKEEVVYTEKDNSCKYWVSGFFLKDCD